MSSAVSGDESRVSYIMAFTHCEICESPYVQPRDVLCDPCRRSAGVPDIVAVEREIMAEERMWL